MNNYLILAETKLSIIKDESAFDKLKEKKAQNERIHACLPAFIEGTN